MTPARQTGATLLVGVLLLAALSLFAVTAASDALLQARMGANRVQDERALRRADQLLVETERALAMLPGGSRPDGCPAQCLAQLPEGVVLEEVALLPATATGPETSQFRIAARFGPADVPVATTSLFARPWGDAGFTGPSMCRDVPEATACGRLGWQRTTP